MSWWGGTGFTRGAGGVVAPTEPEIVGSFVPPTCPTDTTELPFGSICKDVETGKIKIRDAMGVRDL